MVGISDAHQKAAMDNSRFHSGQASFSVVAFGAIPLLALLFGRLAALRSVRVAVMLDAQVATARFKHLRGNGEPCLWKNHTEAPEMLFISKISRDSSRNIAVGYVLHGVKDARIRSQNDF